MSALSRSVGLALGMSVNEVDVVVLAAELHDIGKVAIPDLVLGKPGPLDEEEWRLMRTHTIVGERLLCAVPTLEPVGAIVRSTHERWDGLGYPDGLAGEEIPLAARVVAACDAFDAMLSERPYCPATAARGGGARASRQRRLAVRSGGRRSAGRGRDVERRDDAPHAGAGASRSSRGCRRSRACAGCST